MRRLLPRRRTKYKGAEIEVVGGMLHIFRPNGQVTIPHDVYRHFKSLDDAVEFTGKFLIDQGCDFGLAEPESYWKTD